MLGKITIPERVQLVLLYAKDDLSSCSVTDIFNAKYLNRQPELSAKNFICFKETGSIHSRLHTGRTTATDPETSAQECRHVEGNLCKSLRKVSQETGVLRYYIGLFYLAIIHIERN